MKFIPLPLEGAFLIEPEKRGDERGFFARIFCEKEFAQHGLETQFVQMNNSLSAEMGTLRGLHYQKAPMQEAKVVRCIQGEVYDVILDLREGSSTYGKHFGAYLNPENRLMMYVPKGFAHAILTTKENSELIYFVSQHYSPECESGIRWNDPAFAIAWPIEPRVISEKDKNWTQRKLS